MDLRCADYRAGTVKEKKIARRIRLARIVKTEKIFLTKTLSSDAISGEKIFPAMKFVGGNFFSDVQTLQKNSGGVGNEKKPLLPNIIILQNFLTKQLINLTNWFIIRYRDFKLGVIENDNDDDNDK